MTFSPWEKVAEERGRMRVYFLRRRRPLWRMYTLTPALSHGEREPRQTFSLWEKVAEERGRMRVKS
jgi:hypothetical protein